MLPFQRNTLIFIYKITKTLFFTVYEFCISRQVFVIWHVRDFYWCFCGCDWPFLSDHAKIQMNLASSRLSSFFLLSSLHKSHPHWSQSSRFPSSAIKEYSVNSLLSAHLIQLVLWSNPCSFYLKSQFRREIHSENIEKITVTMLLKIISFSQLHHIKKIARSVLLLLY